MNYNDNRRNDNWDGRAGFARNSYGNKYETPFESTRRYRGREDQLRRNVGNYTTNMLKGSQYPLYLLGLFGNIKKAMLVDTGSAFTIITEDIWKSIKDKSNILEEVPFAVITVTKQAVKILGRTQIQFTIRTKQGKIRKFKTQALIARNFKQGAIIGLDFIQNFKDL